MKRQQIIAIQHPCRFAFETMYSRHRIVDRGLSVILTINSGYE
jgi:hypothetical protein